MPTPLKQHQSLISLFAQKPCWEIKPLADCIGYSTRSVQRFLAELGYINSFSDNGRWYTLSSIPRFNQDGLWFYEDIGFSQSGNLTNTLVDLATASPAGMTAEELGEKLRCRCHSVLVQLCRRGRLRRQKIGRCHRYFAATDESASEQLQVISAQAKNAELLPAEIAVFVLVEFIHHPNYSCKRLAEALARKKNVVVQAARIQSLFEQHGIKKKPELWRQGITRVEILAGPTEPGDKAGGVVPTASCCPLYP